MNISLDTVRVVRLVSGEELLAETHETPTQAKLKNPLILVQVPDQAQPGRANLLPLPWMPYTDADKDGVWIDKSHIVFILKPREDVLKGYQNAFSKIITPAAPKLVINT